MKNFSRAALALAVGAAFVPASAYAAETLVQGRTTGCFSATTCSPTTGAQINTTYQGLTFTPGLFSGTTVNGMLGIGGTSNLGSFLLSTTQYNYTGENFFLRVLFTAPTTTPASEVFSSAISGSVTSLANGGVFIDFDNTGQTVSFSGGTLTLFVNDVSVAAGSAITISGRVMTTAVPEPATWGMMLIGFGMVGGISRYRRKRTLVTYA